MNNESVGVRFIEPAGSIPKRREIRLKSYDYKSNGYFFITICTFRGKSYIKKCKETVEKILLYLPEIVRTSKALVTRNTRLKFW